MPDTTSYPNETTPIVDPNTLEFRRAVTDDEQGYSIICRLKQDSWYRNEKQAAIMRKYNDEPPYDQRKLEAANQGWRSNYSSGFLSSMVKRILPPYNQVIDKAQYLTSAKFPDSETQDPDVQQKQTDFQAAITKCIRGWPGWQAFKTQLILENTLFGYTGAGWTDELTWQPRFLRQDEAYFPDGCSQEARLMPLWCLDQNFQIHEMASYLVDPEASAAAGWNIPNLVIAINDAKPDNRMSGVNQDVRKYQDLIRETSLGLSYSTGVKIIKAVHLFVQEVSGKVSHYIYDDRSKKTLFVRLDRFDSMEQNLSLMALEVGNGKLHGSKGLGRILYNIHVSIDQARNLMVDNMMLGGLLVLKEGDGARPQQALKVMHPLCVVGKGYDVSPTGFTTDVEGFMQMDSQKVQQAEVLIGAFMPGQVDTESGKEKTASEINYVASIEQELREGNLARFYAQFQLTVWEMQKRICSNDNIRKAFEIWQKEQAGAAQMFAARITNFFKSLGKMIAGEFEADPLEPIKDEAVRCCLGMLRKGLTPKDIITLGDAPSYDLTTDTTADMTAAWDFLKENYAGNPNVDQIELIRNHIAAHVGAERMETLVIPTDDETIQAEAARQQLIELVAMANGEQIPVSPRDFDTVHMTVIQQRYQQLMQNPQALTPAVIQPVLGIMAHYDAHLQSALGKAGPNGKASLQQFIQFGQDIQKMLGQAQAAVQKLAASPAANPHAMPAAAQANGGPKPPATNGSDFTHRGLQPPQVLANPLTALQEKPLAQGPLAQVVPPGQ